MSKAKEKLNSTLIDLKIDDLRNEARVLRLKASKLLVEADKIDEEIIRICPHARVEIETENHEGGYLHRGSFIKKWICQDCGEEIDREETDTGYA